MDGLNENISTNVEIDPTRESGFWKKSIAGCLQTRPIDIRHRLIKMRGNLYTDTIEEINHSLKAVFSLDRES
jgi:mRNA interferase MazF